ncbi:hypothetical protein I7I53_08898 [Histoplasma capsulatum var. duboisii H88]|uniref:Uncharacterized protein n=1 Tax=Ajellomyces capsulatus (strain H88) TaxID=544711 RepID=A0A8A1L7R9_AJEC8|nr:hypothetical protein I7I53_08898 [Histoplasma capsulatum var. duboisii H88]
MAGFPLIHSLPHVLTTHRSGSSVMWMLLHAKRREHKLIYRETTHQRAHNKEWTIDTPCPNLGFLLQSCNCFLTCLPPYPLWFIRLHFGVKLIIIKECLQRQASETVT